MDEKLTDQEARRLDLREDERDIDQAFSVTMIVIVTALVLVLGLLAIAVFLVR